MKTNKKIYKDNQYTLSIDPGLNNVGWALFDAKNKKMVEMGVRKFEPAKEAKISRLKRRLEEIMEEKNGESSSLSRHL